jgi:chaperonin cofactor prefoldin
MDWHKLQHTLYKLDPTDPKEDLAKLQQSATNSVVNIPTIDYLKESVEVPKGTMPLAIDSLTDFAKLAGISYNNSVYEDDDKPPRGFAQGFQAVQKGGRWGPDAPSRYIDKKLRPGNSNNKNNSSKSVTIPNGLVEPSFARDLKLAITLVNQDQPVTDKRQHAAMAQAFKTLLANPDNAKRMLTRLTDDINLESVNLKPRNSSSKTMQDLRKSESMSAKKVLPRQDKHKNTQFESIKEKLYQRLNEKR